MNNLAHMHVHLLMTKKKGKLNYHILHLSDIVQKGNMSSYWLIVSSENRIFLFYYTFRLRGRLSIWINNNGLLSDDQIMFSKAY